MTIPSFPRCQTQACSGHSLSFADRCWEHVDREAYVSALHHRLETLPRNSAFPLNLKKVHAADLNFSGLDIRGSSFSQAHITGGSFIGADLSESDMIGARISSCDFVGSDIYCANFTKAIISSSSFSHSDLRGSCFAEAHFRDTDFMGAILFDCILWNADLSGARNIKKSNFNNPSGGKRLPDCHLSEKNALAAYESYGNVKHHFYRNGFYEAGRWAAYRELTMERKHFFEKKDPRYIPSLLMDLLSGYTEKPNRVIVSSLLIITVFGVLYHWFNVPVCNTPNACGGKISLWDSLYFSFITFTTVGYGDFTPRPVIWFRLLACVEAFSGPFMAGLYIFTLTRRYAAN